MDPSAFTGTPEEVLQQTREVRNEIEQSAPPLPAITCNPSGYISPHLYWAQLPQ
jgi:hypothetical protein